MAFITNQKKEGATTLKNRLTELTTHADKLDMLVGFFYFSGVKVMAEAFRDRPNMTLRVLVGMEADLHLGELVEICREGEGASNETIKERFRESLKKIVGSDFADKQAFHERLGIFIDLLQSGRLDIRKTLNPNHAKLYIFELDESQVGSKKYWITGSSNFSEPGLMRRDELNVQIGDFGHQEVQKYFDDLWDESVPLAATEEDKAVIIKILKEASVAADITPFEAYYLVLQNYIEHQQTKLKELQIDNILKDAGFKKYRYQVDAVAQACVRLDAYGGIIIADVVGLGKSIIGGLIGALRAKRGLIICPPGLMGDPKGDAGGWYEYRDKFKLHGWEIWSRGKLDDLEDKLKHDNAFDMVIVDEAHNFRNERTEDYERLANICFGKEVVLLTATPYNNRPGDLLALLRLFTSMKKSPLVAGGDLELKFSIFIARFRSITMLRKALAYRKKHPEEAKKIHPTIVKLLKDCGIEPLKCDFGLNDAKTLAEIDRVSRKLSKQIRQIMEKIVIRRNRLDLLSDPDYKKEIDSLSTVQDPKEQFFELTDEQDEFYDRVINDYFGEEGAFHGAIYHPQAYLKSREGTDEAQESLYHMLLSSLVQRFESSFGAFRKSIESVKRSLEISLEFVEKMHMYLYSRKAMEQVLLLDDDDDREAAMLKAIEEQKEKYEKKGVKTKNAIAYNITGGDFDGKRFVKHIKDDITLLGKILDEVDGLKLESKDPKAASLVKAIGEVLNGTHHDIASEPNAPKRKMIVFSSFTDTIRHIGKLVEKKFPGRVIAVTGANFGKERALEVKRNFDASFGEQADDFDILLATDKLSEGFNLNRAGVVVNYDIPWNPTRVIQRVGRINRIGKKVFDSLYIFNFFPTKKGDEIVANREVAESKMFAIHKILGEDSKMFSMEEEPTAAKLYNKLSHFGEEEDISFYTSAKKKYLEARRILEKHCPEAFERIKGFPNNVKTAWNGNPKETVLLRRCGPSFFALAYGNDTGTVEEIALEDAIVRLECEWDTPRVDFSGEFWQMPNPEDPKRPKDGVYAMLKNYKPTGVVKSGGAGHLNESAQAIAVINGIKGSLPEALRKFAGDVAEDIQNYGSIPAQTVKKIKEAGNIKKQNDKVAELSAILANLLDVRGADYLDKMKMKYEGEAVIVTVEKQGGSRLPATGRTHTAESRKMVEHTEPPTAPLPSTDDSPSVVKREMEQELALLKKMARMPIPVGVGVREMTEDDYPELLGKIKAAFVKRGIPSENIWLQLSSPRWWAVSLFLPCKGLVMKKVGSTVKKILVEDVGVSKGRIDYLGKNPQFQAYEWYFRVPDISDDTKRQLDFIGELDDQRRANDDCGLGIPLPNKAKATGRVPMLVLNEELYRKIESGEKTTEYRNLVTYYCDLFFDTGKMERVVKFQLGYSGKDGGNPERMAWEIKDIMFVSKHGEMAPVVTNGKICSSYRNLPRRFAPVAYAIKLGKRLELDQLPGDKMYLRDAEPIPDMANDEIHALVEGLKAGRLKSKSPDGYLVLKGEFYDAIESGKKRIEYREFTEYNIKRTIGLKTVRFNRGYVKNAPQMQWEVEKVVLLDGEGNAYDPFNVPEDFCPTTIAIHLGNRLQKEE